jgi:monovalent cation:H+ antiporter, CPA1 family
MGGESLVPHILAIIILFFIASISAILLRRIKVPYTIGLVIIGVLLAYFLKDVEGLDVVRDIRLSHDVILYILLPTLIFDAATNIDAKMLFKNLVPILNLAIPGLIISTAIIGFIINKLTPLQMGTAFLFGALISATDPVAVVALFKEIGAPERLNILVDGESLFNDATAIVLFNIIVAGIVSQTSMSMGNVFHEIIEFCIVFFGGIITGIVIAFLITTTIKYARNDPLIHIALSTVLAYISFIVAEYYLEVSGVMSVLAAGIFLSWHGSTHFNKETKAQLTHFWEYASFVCNSFIFLLLGVAELHLIVLIGHSTSIMLYVITAIVSALIARLLVVYFIPHILPFRKVKIDNCYKTIIFWGGLRGAVPLALALSLSRHFEDQQLIVELTLSVVLFTLIVQGTTMKPLMKLLKIKPN